MFELNLASSRLASATSVNSLLVSRLLSLSAERMLEVEKLLTFTEENDGVTKWKLLLCNIVIFNVINFKIQLLINLNSVYYQLGKRDNYYI